MVKPSYSQESSIGGTKDIRALIDHLQSVEPQRIKGILEKILQRMHLEVNQVVSLCEQVSEHAKSGKFSDSYASMLLELMTSLRPRNVLRVEDDIISQGTDKRQ